MIPAILARRQPRSWHTARMRATYPETQFLHENLPSKRRCPEKCICFHPCHPQSVLLVLALPGWALLWPFHLRLLDQWSFVCSNKLP